MTRKRLNTYSLALLTWTRAALEPPRLDCATSQHATLAPLPELASCETHAEDARLHALSGGTLWSVWSKVGLKVRSVYGLCERMSLLWAIWRNKVGFGDGLYERMSLLWSLWRNMVGSGYGLYESCVRLQTDLPTSNFHRSSCNSNSVVCLGLLRKSREIVQANRSTSTLHFIC
jgi:hypothetical protein